MKKALKDAIKNEDWLEKEYIVFNKSPKEIALETKNKVSRVIYYIKKYDLNKDPEKKKERASRNREKTLVSKYGVKNSGQIPEVKKKIRQKFENKYVGGHPLKDPEVRSKIEETSMKKYGHKTSLLNDDVIKKSEETCLKKYGNKSYQKSEQHIEDLIKRNIERYDKEWFFQTDKFKEASKNTSLEKYGVDNPNKSSVIKQKIIKNRIKKYGVAIHKENFINDGKNIKTLDDKPIVRIAEENRIPYNTLNAWINRQKNVSKEDIYFFIENYKNNITDIEHKIISELNIERYNKKFDKKSYPNLNYKPDFKLSDSMALNVDGLYWHCEVNKDKKYHFNMRKDYEDLGLRIFQFRGDEVRDKLSIVKSIINNNLNKTFFKIGARKCSVKRVPSKEAEEFLNENHIKGYKSAKHIGLYYKDSLIFIFSYRIVKSILKVERLCSKINYNVIGGFSKLLKRVIKDNSPSKVHYWVDLRYGTGTFLLKQGFVLEKETLGWEWTDTCFTYNRLKCRANMDKRGLSQKEYAEELGWVKIYDAGQRLWVREV